MMNYNNSRILLIAGIAYILVISIITFAVFGVDKKRARQHAWRITEKALFLLAVFGGSIGAVMGMLVFRHKTKKWYFRIGMPLILAVQLAVIFAAAACMGSG